MKVQNGLRIWPRTILCSAPHRAPKGKDELSAGAGQVKKLPILQYRTLRLTGPCSSPCYSPFATTPNHSRYGLIGQVSTPESGAYMWTLEGG